VRAYEAVFIFDPELSEDAIVQLKERIVKIINSSGNLLGMNVWGKRRLAYPINKKLEGVYYIFEFMGDSTLPRELKRLTTITESIMRSMIVVNEKKTKSEAGKETVEANVVAEAEELVKSEKEEGVSELTSATEEQEEQIVNHNSEDLPKAEKTENSEEE
jgi:small subunit ribosomal protein S6